MTYTSGIETTIYVGGLLEKRTVGSVTEYQHVIPAPDGTRIHRVLRTDSTTDTFYLATDHLGSTDAILNATGGVEVYTSFDAFGQRRDPTDWDGPPSSSDLSKIADTTRRGYTGHEHLDNLGLIHMNGRVQDPLVGRFISADPYVQAPYLSQNLNRYTYGLNGPISYTDPSGHLFVAIDPFGVGTIVAVVRLFQMLVGGDSSPAPGGYRHGPGGSASGGVPGSSERAGVGWRGPQQDTARSREPVQQQQPDTSDNTILAGQTGPSQNSQSAFEEFTVHTIQDPPIQPVYFLEETILGGLGGGLILRAGAATFRTGSAALARQLATRYGTTRARGRILSSVLASDGSLITSKTVAAQLAGERSFIPVQSILETVANGVRVADPQGVAGRFLFSAPATRQFLNRAGNVRRIDGTLDILVNEADGVIEHVLFRSP